MFMSNSLSCAESNDAYHLLARAVLCRKSLGTEFLLRLKQNINGAGKFSSDIGVVYSHMLALVAPLEGECMKRSIQMCNLHERVLEELNGMSFFDMNGDQGEIY